MEIKVEVFQYLFPVLKGRNEVRIKQVKNKRCLEYTEKGRLRSIE